MRARSGATAIAVALLVAACDKAPAHPSSLVGTWTIAAATNPGARGSYRGSVKISLIGDCYALDWTVAGSPPYHGLGIEAGSLLGVGWSSGQSYGVALYDVDGGKLSGRVASSATGGRIGTEELEGPPGPAGTYRIVRARSPGARGSYTGSVAITPTGPTFRVKWTLDRDSFEGVGMLEGATFVVGWGIGGAGVIVYKKAQKALDGTWAQPAAATLGTERLERVP